MFLPLLPFPRHHLVSQTRKLRPKRPLAYPARLMPTLFQLQTLSLICRLESPACSCLAQGPALRVLGLCCVVWGFSSCVRRTWLPHGVCYLSSLARNVSPVLMLY